MNIARQGSATGRRRYQPRRLFVVFFLLAIALAFGIELRAFAGHAVTFVHQGFVAVYLDAENFLSGCF